MIILILQDNISNLKIQNAPESEAFGANFGFLDSGHAASKA
jgi:hypothetical protein